MVESITNWFQAAIEKRFPALDLSPISGKPHGKLRLGPVQLLAVIQGSVLAEWSLQTATRFQLPRLPRGPGGRQTSYTDGAVSC